eukprot:TRINITY_DN1363_c4_g1_i1.p1 TRINITY_DN1363_c4_g1~~TRINITY_DN1363_c4_g1_i1.p1  ORF type:complete len:391 (-),score=70.49 TRINITY_DN1363_c4_g1_i1:245-1417(-)
MAAAPFVDYYAALGSNLTPDSSAAELKKAYHEMLREWHPDKRPTSTTGTGQEVTQRLVDAWEILQDPEKRAAYDQTWQKNRVSALSPEARAEVCRREGNEIYKEAQALSKNTESLSAATSALHKYQAAIEKYSEGVNAMPKDHRLRSNRALCYSALKDWVRCKEDAITVLHIKPDFMKGWFLLCKALWKLGDAAAAQTELEKGLAYVPNSPELIALREDMAPDLQASGETRLPHLSSGRSRNVSPAATPTQGHSRVATPPPVRGASRSPAPHGRGGRQSSRSPAPHGRGFDADATAQFGNSYVDHDRTAQFGCSGIHGSAPTRGRSTSPAPPAPPTHGDSYEGTFGRPPPPFPPAGAGRDPTPPRGGEGPRQKVSSLSGMAASSRLGVQR